MRLYPRISLGMPLRSTLINPGSCCTEFRTWKPVADIHVSPTTCPNKPDHLLIIHPVPPRGSQFKWNVWRNSRVPFAINCNHLENSFIFQMPVTAQHLLTKLTTGHRSPTAKVLNVVRKLIPDVRNTFFFFYKFLWSRDVSQHSVLWVFFSWTDTKPSSLFKNSDQQSFVNAKVMVRILILGSLILSRDYQQSNNVKCVLYTFWNSTFTMLLLRMSRTQK